MFRLQGSSVFRAIKAGLVLAVVSTVACPSPSAPAPILSGTYGATEAGQIAFLTFPDRTQYELIRNQPCNATGANECEETGTFVYDATTGELSLTSDDTGETRVFDMTVQQASAPGATEALQILGGGSLVFDAGSALASGQTSLVCPSPPSTVQGFQVCPHGKAGADKTACSKLTTNPDQMPADVTQFLLQNSWGMHHLEWHTERQWDMMVSTGDKADITQAEHETPPWTRAPIQEGEVGNGYQFLMMHRAMLTVLRKMFPCADFAGWSSPPTNPNDKTYPVPGTNPDRKQAFDANMLKAIANLESSQFIKKNFTGANADDLYGLYVETNLRWVSQANPTGKPTDPTIGMHNYVHNRFSDCGDSEKCTPGPIDMGDPSKNLGNQIFWKHHGWIDNIWSAVRAANNESDTDPAYQMALQNEIDAVDMNMKANARLSLKNPQTQGAASFVERQQAANWGPRP
jgi:hypothetical protein